MNNKFNLKNNEVTSYSKAIWLALGKTMEEDEKILVSPVSGGGIAINKKDN